MMKRVLYYAGLVVFPFFGMGLDLMRKSLVSLNSQTFVHPSRVLIYDAFTAVLFILMVYWLFSEMREIRMPKIAAGVFLLVGLYIVCIPLLYGTALVPGNTFPAIFGFIQVHRTLAGAVLLITGVVKLFTNPKI